MNTKHRIFQDSDAMLTDKDLKYKERSARSIKTRGKSYDFIGNNTDFDEERRKKIEARKQKLIIQYKLGKDNWTKDTAIVLNHLENNSSKNINKVQPNKKKSIIKENYKEDKIKKEIKDKRRYSPEIKDPKWVMAEDYEDPRLTQMKHEMKMHEQLRSQIRSKSPLKGDSTYEHDKKVRELKRRMNTSKRSVHMDSRRDFERRIEKKRKGDYQRIQLKNEELSYEEVIPVNYKSSREVSPLKIKYDYQSSFKIGYDKKILQEEDKYK